MGLVGAALKIVVSVVVVVVILGILGSAFFYYRVRKIKKTQIDDLKDTLPPAYQPGLRDGPQQLSTAIQQPTPVAAMPMGDPYGQYFHDGKSAQLQRAGNMA